MTDEQIISQLRAHDEAGLVALMEQYGQLVRQIIWRYLRSEYERGYTRDIENRAYYRIWANIDQYRSEKGNFAAWLGTIVKNQTLDYKWGLSGAYQDLDLLPEYVATTTLDEDIDWEPYLQQLSGPMQQVFKLFFVDGLYPVEIAKELKMKPATVYKNLSRARQKIQEGGPQLWQS